MHAQYLLLCRCLRRKNCLRFVSSKWVIADHFHQPCELLWSVNTYADRSPVSARARLWPAYREQHCNVGSMRNELTGRQIVLDIWRVCAARLSRFARARLSSGQRRGSRGSVRTRPKQLGIESARLLRRRESIERRIDEVRDWILICDSCEHIGCVELTLRRLRSAKLICSQCGIPVRRRRGS